jgi:hypothetical protein
MSFTLGDEDRRAVDLLLDRDDSKTNGGDGQVAHGRMKHRVQRVEQILSLLSHMTTGEPPPDLVKKALRRIEEARITGQAGQPLERSDDTDRPTA